MVDDGWCLKLLKGSLWRSKGCRRALTDLDRLCWCGSPEFACSQTEDRVQGQSPRPKVRFWDSCLVLCSAWHYFVPEIARQQDKDLCSFLMFLAFSLQDFRVDAGEFTLVGMSPFSQDSQQKIVCIKCRSYCFCCSSRLVFWNWHIQCKWVEANKSSICRQEFGNIWWLELLKRTGPASQEKLLWINSVYRSAAKLMEVKLVGFKTNSRSHCLCLESCDVMCHFCLVLLHLHFDNPLLLRSWGLCRWWISGPIFVRKWQAHILACASVIAGWLVWHRLSSDELKLFHSHDWENSGAYWLVSPANVCRFCFTPDHVCNSFHILMQFAGAWNMWRAPRAAT